MTLTDRIAEAVSVPFSRANESLLLELHKEAFSLSGLCMKCPNRFEDAYQMLKSYLKKHDSMASKKKTSQVQPTEAKYSLKPEYKNIQYAVTGKGMLTKDTLTDQLAEHVIKHIPRLANIFEVKA